MNKEIILLSNDIKNKKLLNEIITHEICYNKINIKFFDNLNIIIKYIGEHYNNISIILIDQDLEDENNIYNNICKISNNIPIILLSHKTNEQNVKNIFMNSNINIINNNFDCFIFSKVIQIAIEKYLLNKELENKVKERTNELNLSNKILHKINKFSFDIIQETNLNESILFDMVSEFGQLLNVDRSYLFKKEELNNNETYLLKYNYNCQLKWNYDNNSNLIGLENIDVIDYCNILSRWDESFKRNIPIYGTIDSLPLNEILLLNKYNIKSLLLIPIYVNHNNTPYLWGFIGFDDCKNKRMWSKLELSSLYSLTNLISRVLSKLKIEKEYNKLINNQIMDMKNARLKIEENIKHTNNLLLQKYG